MFNVDIAKVSRVYSGRSGCMCGCRGKYTASSTATDNVKDKSPVNDKVVRMHFKRIMDFVGPLRPDSNDRNSYSTDSFLGVCYVAIDDGSRTYAAYFTK